jgi:3-isopropylmalate dehydrogenase
LGDLLSDLTGVLAGSLGMLPSACLASDPGSGPAFGVYESTSGSAPDIAGQGIANPIGMILSVGLMFEHTFERADLRKRLDEAVSDTLDAGFMTPDIGGNETSVQVTDAILERLAG